VLLLVLLVLVVVMLLLPCVGSCNNPHYISGLAAQQEE
jgi:hypothetical protein